MRDARERWHFGYTRSACCSSTSQEATRCGHGYALPMTAKERLRQLADELSEQEAEAALVLVERSQHDPMLQVLAAAPEDDEPSDPEEDASAREAYASYRRGEAISLEELRRELDAG